MYPTQCGASTLEPPELVPQEAVVFYHTHLKDGHVVVDDLIVGPCTLAQSCHVLPLEPNRHAWV